MKYPTLLLLCFSVNPFASLRSAEDSIKPDPSTKIQFPLTQLDKDGLRGPANGKVSLSYEFSIPNSEAAKKTVKAIDSTIQFMPGSPGRVRSPKEACLCIGATHHKNWREVLRKLCDLPYVTRIIECHFE